MKIRERSTGYKNSKVLCPFCRTNAQSLPAVPHTKLTGATNKNKSAILREREDESQPEDEYDDEDECDEVDGALSNGQEPYVILSRHTPPLQRTMIKISHGHDPLLTHMMIVTIHSVQGQRPKTTGGEVNI